jgi:hypothetical protein
MAMRPSDTAQRFKAMDEGPDVGLPGEDPQAMRLEAARQAMIRMGIIEPDEFSEPSGLSREEQGLGLDTRRPSPEDAASKLLSQGGDQSALVGERGQSPQPKSRTLEQEQQAAQDARSMAGRPPQSTRGKLAEPEKDAPKAALDRFEAVGEMDFDKVARPPGDPFVYAMKGDKIFVMDSKNPKAGFRDVTGIQNAAAIRSVIEKFGKAAEPYAKRSGGGTMDMRELTGVEDRPPLEEERILGTKR